MVALERVYILETGRARVSRDWNAPARLTARTDVAFVHAVTARQPRAGRAVS